MGTSNRGAYIMKLLRKYWGYIAASIGTILLIAAITQMGMNVYSHVATASELETVIASVQVVSQKVDRHVLVELRDDTQQQIWDLEDRWRDRYFKEHEEWPESDDLLLAYMNEDAILLHRSLTEKLDDLKQQIEDLGPEEETEET